MGVLWVRIEGKEKIGEILTCKKDHFITTVEGEEKLYTMSTSEKTGWTVVGVANINELFPGRQATQSIFDSPLR